MKLLIVGTGRMAGHHAESFAAIDGVELAGAVDVRPEVLDEFCAQHGIERKFASVDEALAWGDFDSVTVVTPDNAHYAAAIPCIEAGKNILCEKPLAPTYGEADEMATAAERAGKVNMVHLTYRKSAALQRAQQVVQSGALGQLRHIEASYLQSWLAQDAWGDWKTESAWLWRLSTKHGSKGVLGDIGVHLLDFASYAAGEGYASTNCRLRTFHKAPDDKIGEYELDANDSFAINATMESGACAVLHATRWASGHHNDIRLQLFGDKGGLVVEHYGLPGGETLDRLQVCTGADIKTRQWKEIELGPVPTVIESFAHAVLQGGDAQPSFRHAADLQKVLDMSEASNEEDKTFHLG